MLNLRTSSEVDTVRGCQLLTRSFSFMCSVKAAVVHITCFVYKVDFVTVTDYSRCVLSSVCSKGPLC